MNILVALDSNYVGPLTVMLTSIMCSNPVADFNIYVAHSSLTDEDIKKIEASVDATRCKIIPIFIQDNLLAHAPTKKRISKETYYRLIAAEYLPKDVKKILYLDPDIVVINPLYRFYNIDMGKNFFAGATHVDKFTNNICTKRLRMDKESAYINAGVLLMNIEELRRRQSIPVMFRFVKRNESKLLLADQDVLNSLYYKEMIEINPLLYNLDEKTYVRRRTLSGGKKIDLDWVEKNTCIIHFNGKHKPWKEGEDYKGVLDVFYYKYCNL